MEGRPRQSSWNGQGETCGPINMGSVWSHTPIKAERGDTEGEKALFPFQKTEENFILKEWMVVLFRSTNQISSGYHKISKGGLSSVLQKINQQASI